MGFICYMGIQYGKVTRDLKANCDVGDATVVLQDPIIKTTSIIDYSVIGASGDVINVTKANVVNGQVTLTFKKVLVESAVAKVRIENV